jgi:hypothetical protein
MAIAGNVCLGIFILLVAIGLTEIDEDVDNRLESKFLLKKASMITFLCQ